MEEDAIRGNGFTSILTSEDNTRNNNVFQHISNSLTITSHTIFNYKN